MVRRMIYVAAVLGLTVFGVLAWNMTARAGYESAEYTVIEAEGKYEVREYPDLTLVSTSTNVDSQGRDGSFMKLFGYISGANESQQKISMTTPVFMENNDLASVAKMGFVMPKEVAVKGAPLPTGPGVTMRTRKGGRFAVLRFSGQLNTKTAKEAETKLRSWMAEKDLIEAPSTEGSSSVESAGYDPPFMPGPLRRNEILIRLK